MQRIRDFWAAFRNFMIFFSFIMNFVLFLVLIFTVYLIFQIKNDLAEPLIDGLHSNFVGLNEARIQTEISVDDNIPIDFDLTVEDTIPINFNLDVVDTIPISFDLALQETTVVTLSQDVPLDNVPAIFTIAGGAGSITGSVDITLPAGTPLSINLALLVPVNQQIPIHLNVPVQQDIPINLLVPVQQEIPIHLNVPVDIALRETQLSEPFTNLRDLFEPFVRALDNLPRAWSEVRPFISDVLNGRVNLMRETDGSRNAWPGFSATLVPSETPETDIAGEEVETGDNLVIEETPLAPTVVVPSATPEEATPAPNSPTLTVTPFPSPTPSN